MGVPKVVKCFEQSKLDPLNKASDSFRDNKADVSQWQLGKSIGKINCPNLLIQADLW